MNLTTHSEIIRLIANEPLTLSCSALADFLWEDFIRDARPSVTYLIDSYNIKQLSRFGKELFERLYNGDNVNWLVTEDDYEDYFRKMCDGDTKAVPRGFKPENSIWYAIMGDLSQAAAWPTLLHRSIGDQFNAGNNAVNILNELSKVITEAIEQGQFDVQLLTDAGKKLRELREQFQEAQAKGDRAEAEKLRREGKALAQDISDAVEKARDKIQSQSHKIIDKALENCQETNDAVEALHGSQAGVGSHSLDLQEKKDLAKSLSYNKQLQQLIKKLGALRRIWQERKRARKITDKYESITGAKFSDDVPKAFSSEIALAGTEQGRALFALKYSQKTLLTKDFTAHRKDIGKGPIVMYIDVSGSMGGEPEIWSKAIAFVIAEQALKEKRSVQIYLFDTRIEGSVTLSADRNNNLELLDFVGTWTLGGGTSFNAVLAHALDKANIKERADVLMITDGHSEVHDNFINRLNKFKQTIGMQWSTICVNSTTPAVCKMFSDELYSVNLKNQNDTVDVIQRCLR